MFILLRQKKKKLYFSRIINLQYPSNELPPAKKPVRLTFAYWNKISLVHNRNEFTSLAHQLLYPTFPVVWNVSDKLNYNTCLGFSMSLCQSVSLSVCLSVSHDIARTTLNEFYSNLISNSLHDFRVILKFNKSKFLFINSYKKFSAVLCCNWSNININMWKWGRQLVTLKRLWQYVT